MNCMIMLGDQFMNCMSLLGSLATELSGHIYMGSLVHLGPMVRLCFSNGVRLCIFVEINDSHRSMIDILIECMFHDCVSRKLLLLI